MRNRIEVQPQTLKDCFSGFKGKKFTNLKLTKLITILPFCYFYEYKKSIQKFKFCCPGIKFRFFPRTKSFGLYFQQFSIRFLIVFFHYAQKKMLTRWRKMKMNSRLCPPSIHQTISLSMLY